MRPGRSGVELALALEDGQVLVFHRAANCGDEGGGVVAGVAAGNFQRGEQGRGQVFRGDGSGNVGDPGLREGFVETACAQCALGLGAVGDPRVVVLALDPPAGLGFHGFQPGVDGVLAALGADFRGVGLEGHAGEALTMQAAEIGLVGMEIHRAEPFAGETAAGDRLKIPCRWIHLDGFLLDEFVA